MDPSFEQQRQTTPDGMLPIRRCNACGEAHWYPRQKCPLCHSFDTVWEHASAEGEIYSYTVMRKSPDGPYAVVVVTLDVGPRVFVTMRDADFDRLRIGARVRLVAKECDAHGALAVQSVALPEGTSG